MQHGRSRLARLARAAVASCIALCPAGQSGAASSFEEKPRLRDILFTGTELPVSRREILERLAEVGLDERAHPRVSEEDARRAAQLVEQLLVDYAVTGRLEKRRDAGVDLVLHLEPKALSRIQQIVFSGNRALSDEELRRAMRLRPSGPSTWFNDRERLSSVELQRDLERIRLLYQSRGFFAAEVGPARVEDVEPGEARLQIPISEGEIFSWGRLTVEAGSLLTDEELTSALAGPAGAPYDAPAVRETSRTIERQLQERGYPAARVELDERPDPARRSVVLTARVVPGPLCLIGRIEMRGHRFTPDPAVRQYLSVEESKPYRLSSVERSVALLGSLGYFRRVSPSLAVRPEQGRVDITFDLEEGPRIKYFLGGSVSGEGGASGNLTVRVVNPWGWGGSLQASGDLGNRLQDVALGYENPFLPGRRFGWSAAFARRRLDYPDDTSDEERSFRLGLAGPRGSRRILHLGFRYGSFRLGSDLEGPAPFLTEFLGRRFDTRRLRAGLGFDGRDRPFFATRGAIALAEVELAGGPLGGDLNLWRVRARASQIFSLDGRSRHLLSLSARWERVWSYRDTRREGLPRFERLFLGGEQDLRGFRVRGVGPRAPDGAVVGGDQLAYSSVEYAYAFVPWLRAAGFVDAGNTWASDYQGSAVPDLRYDAGLEIQLQAPFLGLPLRAGYAFNLDSVAGESRGRFFFALAARF
jgi:outer membrane protein insertion porin family